MKPTDIRAAFVSSGLTYTKFASKIGCHESTLTRWMNGQSKPTGLYLKRLKAIIFINHKFN